MADSEGDSFEANLNEVVEIQRENGFEFSFKKEQHEAIRQLFLKKTFWPYCRLDTERALFFK